MCSSRRWLTHTSTPGCMRMTWHRWINTRHCLIKPSPTRCMQREEAAARARGSRSTAPGAVSVQQFCRAWRALGVDMLPEQACALFLRYRWGAQACTHGARHLNTWVLAAHIRDMKSHTHSNMSSKRFHPLGATAAAFCHTCALRSACCRAPAAAVLQAGRPAVRPAAAGASAWGAAWVLLAVARLQGRLAQKCTRMTLSSRCVGGARANAHGVDADMALHQTACAAAAFMPWLRTLQPDRA